MSLLTLFACHVLLFSFSLFLSKLKKQVEYSYYYNCVYVCGCVCGGGVQAGDKWKTIILFILISWLQASSNSYGPVKHEKKKSVGKAWATFCSKGGQGPYERLFNGVRFHYGVIIFIPSTRLVLQNCWKGRFEAY